MERKQLFFRKPGLPDQPIQVRVVDNWDDRVAAIAVTAAVYLGEEDGVFSDHFKPNDFTSTYILAYVGSEPAGIIRCRWFADFARLERLTILKRYRNLTVLNALGRAALNLCRKKGYSRVHGLAREDVVPFWRRLGGVVCGEMMESEYGRIAPILVTLSDNYTVAEPFRSTELGTRAFEHRILHEFEGAGVT